MVRKSNTEERRLCKEVGVMYNWGVWWDWGDWEMGDSGAED